MRIILEKVLCLLNTCGGGSLFNVQYKEGCISKSYNQKQKQGELSANTYSVPGLKEYVASQKKKNKKQDKTKQTKRLIGAITGLKQGHLFSTLLSAMFYSSFSFSQETNKTIITYRVLIG